MTTFGDRIAAVREYKALNQKQFSDAIGVSRSFLSEVENGKSKPSIEMLSGIAGRYGDIDTDWLLTGNGSMLRDDGKNTHEPTPEDPLARRKALVMTMVEQIVERIDDDRGLDEIQVDLQKIKRAQEMEREIAELRRKTGDDKMRQR